MKNIDVNKFYKTIDQLMSHFSPPRVSTSFERKVGAETNLNFGNLSLIASSDALHRLAPTFFSKLVDTLGGVKSDMS